MSLRQGHEHGLPHTLDFLRYAEGVEAPPREPFPNQVTFPIHAEGQLRRLKDTLTRKGIVALASCTARDGLRVGFSTEEDAVLAKMSFNA